MSKSFIFIERGGVGVLRISEISDVGNLCSLLSSPDGRGSLNHTAVSPEGSASPGQGRRLWSANESS